MVAIKTDAKFPKLSLAKKIQSCLNFYGVPSPSLGEKEKG